jgi:hypothetical protein
MATDRDRLRDLGSKIVSLLGFERSDVVSLPERAFVSPAHPSLGSPAAVDDSTPAAVPPARRSTAGEHAAS